MDHKDFWHLSFWEYRVIMAGTNARLAREHDARAWLAWHIAALPGAKKFPKLEDLQSAKPSKRRRKTPEEMLSIAHMWTAATAGPH